MNTEEQDPLWNLLGKAKKPGISPFFARNVLRKIRESEKSKPRPAFGLGAALTWIIRPWRMALPASIALVLLAINIGQFVHTPDFSPALVQQNSENSDYEVIVQLDELLAYEENLIWLENPVY